MGSLGGGGGCNPNIWWCENTFIFIVGLLCKFATRGNIGGFCEKHGGGVTLGREVFFYLRLYGVDSWGGPPRQLTGTSL